MDTVKRRKQALQEVATISGACDAKGLFSGYVVRRLPFKFSGVECEVESEKFQIDKIVDHLGYDGRLKVERRDAHGFGGGRDRQEMFLEELVEKLRDGDDSYYLTTQYEKEGEEEEEEEEEENQGESDEEEESEESEASEEDLLEEFQENGENPSDTNLTNLTNLTENDSEHFTQNEVSDSESELLASDFADDYIDLSPEEIHYRVRELFQPPLTPHKLPISPSLFPTLVPQQINLWMGRCNERKANFKLNDSLPDLGLGRYVPNGQSSGLHHDHADNLYILVSGRKRFTIFPPSSGRSLATLGTIRTIHDTGIIDYEHDEKAPLWRHIRDDGALETEVLRWKSDRKEKIDESVILEEEERLKPTSSPSNISSSTSSSPPSFSTIPPALLHIEEFDPENQKRLADFARKTYPELLAVPRYTVWLQKGEMLYLPAGWFHEVTSFGDNEENIHIAINYWFAPPNSHDFETPYKDNYWPSDFARTREAVSEWN